MPKYLSTNQLRFTDGTSRLKTTLMKGMKKLRNKKKEKGINEEIKQMISDRLDLGQSKYKQDVPLNDDRDFVQETLEELLDACVYLSAQILRVKNKIK